MQVEEPNTEYLGRAIASLRTAKGMKRMDLKEESGLSYPYIAEIENGSKKSPSLKAVSAIARALGVSPAELQARAEELKSDDLEATNALMEAVPLEFSVSGSSPAAHPALRQTGKPEDELTERILAKVLEAAGPQIRDLIAREVRYAIREELLQTARDSLNHIRDQTIPIDRATRRRSLLILLSGSMRDHAMTRRSGRPTATGADAVETEGDRLLRRCHRAATRLVVSARVRGARSRARSCCLRRGLPSRADLNQ